MKTINRLLVAAVAVAGMSTAVITGAHAATLSSTKVELLYGYNYKRGPGFSETDEAILTIANASGFTWGDSYFFLDVVDLDDRDGTGGIHLEWGPRVSLLRAFGKPQWQGLVKDIYAIVQADFDNNSFVNKWTRMGGLSLDWNVPNFKFVKTHLQFRDDPTLSGSSVQFNLVWNSGFRISSQNFSFEGFLDYTSPEGGGNTNLLIQPQLLWHANKSLALGVEYQYWQNRLGIKDLDEKAPQIMGRWTF